MDPDAIRTIGDLDCKLAGISQGDRCSDDSLKITYLGLPSLTSRQALRHPCSHRRDPESSKICPNPVIRDAGYPLKSATTELSIPRPDSRARPETKTLSTLPPAVTDAASPSETAPRPFDEQPERRNTITLILHQVLYRIAWIFKTESVVMPAFLDSITSAGWVSGLLPPINRLGQSVTPLLLSGRLRDAPLKTRWLPRTTLLMALPFLILSGLVTWSPAEIQQWMPAIFLGLYAMFFATTGTNQAVYNTVQGKLITPNRRGRLVAIAGYVGSPMAILAVLLIMRPWVNHSPPLFGFIFLFTGGAFVAASFCARFLIEEPDTPRTTKHRRPLRESWHCLREDPHLRRLCVLSGLVACTMVVFPYYQRLGRSLPGYESGMLMTWVICQNLGAAGFSWIAGRVADFHGTRSALRMLTLAAVLSPVIPLLLWQTGTVNWYWITFLWLGTVPVTFRMKMNYVLELTDPHRHPIYISTAALCTTPVIFLSPLAGELIARQGYVLPFLLVSSAAVVAWIMTLFIVEPRSPEFQR